MGKLAKVFWILLSVSLIIIYVTGALYVNDKHTFEKRNIPNQTQFYNSKKKELSKQKINLMYIQKSLLSELSTEKEIEQTKTLELQLEQTKSEEDKQKQINDSNEILKAMDKLLYNWNDKHEVAKMCYTDVCEWYWKTPDIIEARKGVWGV